MFVPRVADFYVRCNTAFGILVREQWKWGCKRRKTLGKKKEILNDMVLYKKIEGWTQAYIIFNM